MKSGTEWIWRSRQTVEGRGNRSRFALMAIAAVMLLVLVACGDGASPSVPNTSRHGGGDRSLKGAHTIGGSINGLSASGLVLLDNGADMLRVAKDATKFIFAMPLAPGSSYDVSIGDHPYGQYCSVSSHSGVAAIDITSVAVNCGDWDSAHAMVITVAGSATAGNIDGAGATALFNLPFDIAVDASGNAYVTDSGNYQIRKISPAGVVSTLAGSGTKGSADGIGGAASFDALNGVAVDAIGNVYVTDGNKIRRISSSGVVSTLAGGVTSGNADGMGAQASFNTPLKLAVDRSGNVYVADTANDAIRKLSPAGVVSTFAAGVTAGRADGIGEAAPFHGPLGIVVDMDGNVYVGDNKNHRIRKITPAGVVSTFTGSGTTGSGAGTGAASFPFPLGLAIDAAGNVYVADGGLMHRNVVRKITSSGVVSTLAGGGATAPNADGVGTHASFKGPTGLAVDAKGNVYVADALNNEIRKITRTR